MRRRHPLPRLWMMTDERQGEQLLASIMRLPAGSGVIFRHYSLPLKDRKRLFGQVARLAKRRRLKLLLAGPPSLALGWGADGSHGFERGRKSPAHLIRSVSAHNARDLVRASRLGADLIFLSPVFDTSSHPGSGSLGSLKFAKLAGRSSSPVIALGGMNRKRANLTQAAGAYGWAAIDALTLKAD